MSHANRMLLQGEGLKTLGALSNPARLAIFQWLLRHEPAFVPVGDIAEQLGHRRASLSSHLTALTRAGLVCALGSGEDTRFRACVSRIEELSTFLAAECCEGHGDQCLPGLEGDAPRCDRQASARDPEPPPRERASMVVRERTPVDAALAPHPLLAAIADRAIALGPALAERAAHAGLAVTQSDGTLRSIPIGALPEILSDGEIARRAELAAHLVSATAKAARWRMSSARRSAVLSALGPAEQRLVQATWKGPADLAVARVDFLGSSDLYALEVNTTIPAMQGYSDIAAEAWLTTFAADRSDLSSLIRNNGSNAQALLQALADLYARSRTDELASVGLLCRRGDAQLTELRYLRDRFRAEGLDAHIVHPDELTWQRGFLVHQGQPLQLVYRHLFLSRLDATPAPDLETVMTATTRHGTLVLNRPSPHLEMKSTLAWLSLSMESPEHAHAMELSDAERRAIRSAVPWTRSLSTESLSLSERDDLVAEIRAKPEAFVLKRSWSYGGHDVFVGRAHDTGAFWSRVHATYPDVDSWSDLVLRAAEDTRGGGFTVQRAIPRELNEQILCTPTSAERARVLTDYAAYASVGTTPDWSGVCRAAVTDVVNIVGGGAVVPIIRRQVADALFTTPSRPARANDAENHQDVATAVRRAPASGNVSDAF
jgi:DNA-binding transcriptional ArsR family regulator